MIRDIIILGVFCLAATAFLTIYNPSAEGATITVTANAPDDNTGSDSQCSLREAISSMNVSADVGDCTSTGTYGSNDTINLPAGTYTNALTGGGEDGNASGDLDILASVTITGAGASNTVIDGGAIDRVIHIPGAVTVSITGVTIRNGSVGGSGSWPFWAGAGIANAGTLSINNSSITGNVCSTRCWGGGIYSTGALTINASTISNNQTANVSGIGDGGGVLIHGNSLNINHSTISGNFSSQLGGGIRSEGVVTANITNSTISGNNGGASSGAIFAQNGSTFTVINSTISDNQAGSVGGIRVVAGATVILKNTIVGKSTGGGQAGGDCSGTITDNGWNIASDNTCGFTHPNSLNNTNPMLDVLADNGAPTQTHALQSGSPAIDAGDDATCAAAPVIGVDQRYAPRPEGAHCDIGAYEYGATPPPSGLVSWWRAEGNALDSISTNHGTITNGATFAPGLFGQAFSLDGVDDYVEIPNSASLNPSNAFSVYGLFYIDPAAAGNSGGWASLIAKGDGATGHGGWFLWFQDTGGYTKALRFDILTWASGGEWPRAEVNNIITNAGWYHIAGTFDISSTPQAKLYVNGTLVASSSASIGSILNNTLPVRIGASHWTDVYGGGNDRFEGNADEVQIYNRALSQAEIQSLLPTFTVTTTVSGNGTISPTDPAVHMGATQDLTITPDANHHVVSVSGCGGTWGGSAKGGTYITGAITADCEVTATFAIDQYSITASANPAAGGSVSCVPNPVDHGATSACTVTTNTGYTLSGVSGTCGGALSGNTYTTDPVTQDCTVEVTFSLNQYTLTVTKTGSGSGTVSATGCTLNWTGNTGNCTATHGTSIGLSGSANTDSAFTGWGGDCSSCGTSADCNITMDTDKTCAASFDANVTVTSPNGGDVIASGGSHTITWTALSGATTFDLDYSINDGNTWRSIATGVTGTSYAWSVPVVAGNKRKCLVRVTGYDSGSNQVGQDTSDSRFMIEVIRITSPTGGEIYTPGDTVPIVWSTNATKTPVYKVVIKYHQVGVTGWNLITVLKGGDPGSYDWLIPTGFEAGQYRLKVNLWDANKNRRGADKTDGLITIN